MQLLELIGPGDETGRQRRPAGRALRRGAERAAGRPRAGPALPRRLRGPGPDAAPTRRSGSRRTASAEFRRFTENDLRARKRDDALAVVRALDGLSIEREGGALLQLKPDESRQWLGALNDLRLAIGTRLEVTDEDDGAELYRLPDSDPRKPMVMAYLWLGGLQETLVETLHVLTRRSSPFSRRRPRFPGDAPAPFPQRSPCGVRSTDTQIRITIPSMRSWRLGLAATFVPFSLWSAPTIGSADRRPVRDRSARPAVRDATPVAAGALSRPTAGMQDSVRGIGTRSGQAGSGHGERRTT